MAKQAQAPKHILSIDIGGSKVKFLASGETEPRRIPSGAQLSQQAWGGNVQGEWRLL